METNDVIILIIIVSVALFFAACFIYEFISISKQLTECSKKMTEAIELLTLNSCKKTDKPLKPESKKASSVSEINVCPVCKEHIYSYQKCCSNCGQRLDWNKK